MLHKISIKAFIFFFIVFLFSALYCFSQDKKKERCKAIKENKEQCKLYAQSPSAYCYYHNPNAERCNAKTKKGTCKRIVSKKGEKCYQHKQ